MERTCTSKLNLVTGNKSQMCDCYLHGHFCELCGGAISIDGFEKNLQQGAKKNKINSNITDTDILTRSSNPLPTNDATMHYGFLMVGKASDASEENYWQPDVSCHYI